MRAARVSPVITNSDRFERLQERLLLRFGELVGSDELQELLGFPSRGALRQAIHRNTLGLKLFNLPGRAGKYALTCDVAEWIWGLRSGSKKTQPETAPEALTIDDKENHMD